MKPEPVLRRAAARAAHRAAGAIVAAAALVLLAACGSAPVVKPAPRIPPVTSSADAAAQLTSVARERAAIEARFADREQVCYNKFFVNRCLDEAKEQRRAALVVQRAIEVQAERYQRQAVVDERDRQMVIAEQRFKEQEARLAAEPPKPPPTVKPEAPARTSTVPARVAQRNARVQADKQQEAQDAGKRAQNVRDYEARQADAAEHQQRVAQRKADKAARDAKDAADKAKAAQGTPPAAPAAPPAQGQ